MFRSRGDGEWRERCFRAWATACLGATLAACGGGGGDDTAATPVPHVAALASGPTVPVGGEIVVVGEGLDAAFSFSIGGAAARVLSQSASRVSLGAPDAAVQGTLAFEYLTAGGTRSSATTPYAIEVWRPAAVIAFSAPGGLPGTPITVQGVGLENTQRIRIGATEATPTEVSASAVRFSVPQGARSGALALTTRFQGEVAVTPLFTVVRPIEVTAMAADAGREGTLLRVRGTGLSQVQGVAVGPARVAATILNDTELTALLPGAVEGEVQLQAPLLPATPAGRYLLTDRTALSLSLTVVQQFAQSATDPRARLLAHRPVLLKADLTSALPGSPAPSIVVTLMRDGVEVAALPLQGPPQLPLAADRYDLNNSFSVLLPQDWVVPGAQFRIDVAAWGVRGITQTVALPIDPVPAMSLTIVPVLIGGRAPTLPSAGEIRAVLARAFPLLDTTSLTLRIRAPYAPAALPAAPTYDDVNGLLAQIDTLRRQEAPGDFYYAMIDAPSLYRSGLSGLAYRPGPGAYAASGGGRDAYLSGLGEDDQGTADAETNPFGWRPRRWAVTMVHELGHMLTRPHAPCATSGKIDGVDTEYPYASGGFGDAAIHDPVSGLFAAPFVSASPGAAPVRMPDVMGHCGGDLFSDYNYAAVGEALQAYSRHIALPAAARSVRSRAAAASTSVGASVGVRISGRIVDGRVVLDPLTLDEGGGAPAGTGTHRLHVTVAGGEQLELPFTPVTVEDGGRSTAHFAVTMPDRGPLASIELVEPGGPGKASSGQRAARPQDRMKSKAATSVPARVEESSTGVRLVWDAAAHPFASLVHRDDDGRRTVLGLQLRAGVADFDAAALPSGGRWVVETGSAFEVRRVEFPRAWARR